MPCNRKPTFGKKKKASRGTPSCLSLSVSKFTPTPSLNTVLLHFLLTQHVNMEPFPQTPMPNTANRLHLHRNQPRRTYMAITFPKSWRELEVSCFTNAPPASMRTVQVSPESVLTLERQRQTKRMQKETKMFLGFQKHLKHLRQNLP